MRRVAAPAMSCRSLRQCVRVDEMQCNAADGRRRCNVCARHSLDSGIERSASSLMLSEMPQRQSVVEHGA
jgi:hypothetical protein